MDGNTEVIIREASRIEEDALYSAKSHFVAARLWGSAHLWLGIPAAVLAAVAGTTAFSEFDNHSTVAGIISIIVVALTTVSTFLNPSEKAHAHLTAGNHYNALRNQARMFREIEAVQVGNLAELTKRLQELAKQRDELNERSPQVPWWAFTRARAGIEAGEAQYVADAGGKVNP